jgi:hypothetical protein
VIFNNIGVEEVYRSKSHPIYYFNEIATQIYRIIKDGKSVNFGIAGNDYQYQFKL